ncbi:bifunctional PTPA superfamily/Phosphotyrosyl phosphatase activator [Babesia duncani]|uniref:Serine/threonine-protein phosphatase 2A activator n=1 Tax=Babesia duncani TaxID=323732 RepID=A0AAD9PGS6_9APIC|nr:bifunctional PTPA superfamily/Phosphotyrosyl phosphatase activator [Babesia duncani]KAK2195742.1 bifunctional PTPA superfamily/Phosphotyrosyl phosphatase activator [Babesia duncani]
MTRVMDSSLHTSHDILSFVKDINKSIKSIPNTEFACNKNVEVSDSTKLEAVDSLKYIIQKLGNWTKLFDPKYYDRTRFGNQGFRKWHDHIKMMCDDLFEESGISINIIGVNEFPKVKATLLNSFGCTSRLDYGTGHELQFIYFLQMLYNLKILHHNDLAKLAITVINEYFELVRRLLERYSLEPAGSKGAWGIDPYQFLPYLFGSSQLISNELISPMKALERDFVEQHKDQYIFMKAMKYAMDMSKDTPLEISCPMLVNIAINCSWEKMNEGMIKMYDIEVVSRFKSDNK